VFFLTPYFEVRVIERNSA